MIITCPNCRTRYRIAADAISAVGRKVQCASCHEAWTATPSLPVAFDPIADIDPSPDEAAFSEDDDTLFTAADESLLDRHFERTAEAVAAESDIETVEVAGATGTIADTDDADDADAAADPTDDAARQKAHARRRRQIDRSMPLARFRRGSRWTVLVLFVAIAVAVLGFRTELVRAFPELGSLFAQVGLGTNLVGLDFSGVRTLKTTRDGVDVLQVTATLANVTTRAVDSPPVLVSLIDASGVALYEWSVTPSVRLVPPGGSVEIETRLTAPPDGLDRVRLTFAYGQNRADPGLQQTP